jgi:endonuclease-3
MERSKKVEFIANTLQELYPDTHTFLEYQKDYELLFATILSAQATDKSVNEATSRLFKECPRLEDYNQENKALILDCIKKVGLGKSKCEYLIKTADILLKEYRGELPRDRKALMALPGVGYKTSGVVLAELYDDPFIPVDTHVFRVSHRLGLVNDKLTPEETEVALERLFKGKHSIHLHRQFILLGRNICLARNEKCDLCPLKEVCKNFSKKK